MDFNSLKFLPSLKSTNSSRPAKAGFFCLVQILSSLTSRTPAFTFPSMSETINSRPLTIGLHGVGAHARTKLLPTIARSPGLRLGGISTRDPSTLDAQCRQWSCPGWNSLAEMLDNAELDVVMVSTPIHCHFGDALEVLNAGLHLWIEKSFCADFPQAQTLVELADKRDLAVCVSLAPAYHAQFRAIKTAIAGGEIGPIRAIAGNFGFPHTANDDPKYDPAQGGGALLDVGYYPILMAAALMDGIPSVGGAAMSRQAGFDVDTDGAALLSFPSGVQASAHWGYGRDYINEMVVLGEHGTIIATPAFSKPAHLSTTLTVRRQNQTTAIDLAESDQFSEMLSAFADATQDGNGRRNLRKTALEHQRLLAQVAASAVPPAE